MKNHPMTPTTVHLGRVVSPWMHDALSPMGEAMVAVAAQAHSLKEPALAVVGRGLEAAGHVLLPVSMFFDGVLIGSTLKDKDRKPRENVTGIAIPIVHTGLLFGVGVAGACGAPAIAAGMGIAGVTVGIGNGIARLCFWAMERKTQAECEKDR